MCKRLILFLFFSVSNGGLWNDEGCRRILPADEEVPPDKFSSRCVCNETESMKYSLLVLEHEATVRHRIFSLWLPITQRIHFKSVLMNHLIIRPRCQLRDQYDHILLILLSPLLSIMLRNKLVIVHFP